MMALSARASGLLDGLGARTAPCVSPADQPSKQSHDDASPESTLRIFRREGEYWTTSFGGQTSHLRETRGFEYLRALLQAPGTDLHALQLAALGAPAWPTRPDGGADRAPGHLGGLLDNEAKKAYRSRLEDLDNDIAETEAFGDDERASRAREERERFWANLAGPSASEAATAPGLSGRASESERHESRPDRHRQDRRGQLAPRSPPASPAFGRARSAAT